VFDTQQRDQIIGSLKWCHDARRCWQHCTFIL